MPRKKKSVEDKINEQVKEALEQEEKEKLKKKREIELRKFVIPTLRRASYRWKPRAEAEKAARVERGVYKCAMCEGLFSNKEKVIDHKLPVVDVVNGWQGWEDYINRMFCEEEGFQVLCKTCHGVKTNLEEKMRVKHRKDKKKTKNKD